MDMVSESRSIGQRQRCLVVRELAQGLATIDFRLKLNPKAAHHGVCEGGRHGDQHPPDQPFHKVFALPSDQSADQPSIELRDVQADQRPQNEEH